MIFRESALAHKYCVGEGIEIGGSAHNPFGLNCLNVDITDKDTCFKIEEKRLCGKSLPVDIIASGDDLPFENNSLDFVISSHVLEHFTDPIKALIEWNRVLKINGIIFMIVPHKDRTFDRDRDKTTLLHILNDYYDGNTNPHRDRINGHDHVWVAQDIIDILNWISQETLVQWQIIEVQDPDDKVGNGFTIVIQKIG